MKKTMKMMAMAAVLSAAVASSGLSYGQTLVEDFNTLFENELYASWASPEAVIVSGPDSYSVTATGYGSNYIFIGEPLIVGAGNTHLELDITLSGPPTADGHLGPIVSLVDADGSYHNFAWFGQLLGNHILTKSVMSPDWITAPGTTPGLDLDNLLHMHLQLDPGGFGTQGQYTPEWNNLNLITVEGTPGDFDDDGDIDGRDFLVWQRGNSPSPLSAADLAAWQNGYGGGPLVATSAVPEPSSICVMILASISAIGLRRPSRLLA